MKEFLIIMRRFIPPYKRYLAQSIPRTKRKRSELLETWKREITK